MLVDEIYISIPFLRPLLYAGFRYHLSRAPPPSPRHVLAINTVRNGTIYKTKHLTAPAFSLSRAKFSSRRFFFVPFPCSTITQLMGLCNTRILSLLADTFARILTSPNFRIAASEGPFLSSRLMIQLKFRF